MVDTSLDISAADDLKTRSSAKAGLDAGIGADEGVAEEEAFAVEEDAAPGVLLMDFIAPVVGMERAMAKNSSVRSIMVKVICIDVWFSQSCSDTSCQFVCQLSMVVYIVFSCSSVFM